MKRFPSLLPALIIFLNLLPAVRATAQTFTNLHNFTGSDGSTPYSRLILSGSTLYGTAIAGANSGGSSGNGTIFAINTDGSGFTNVYDFTSDGSPFYTNGDGANPYAELILSSNMLYGTTYEGGASGVGTVFAVNTNGLSFTNLHNFTAGLDGGGPDAGLLQFEGTLFGTAAYGGASNYGVVFAVSTDGSHFTNLYSFTNGTDGAGPAGVLILAGNLLYGTTSGGNGGGSGSVFAVKTNGMSFTNLHTFTATSGFPNYTNTDGDSPEAGLLLSGGILYGTGSGGGKPGFGTVFAINTNGLGFTNLYYFTNGTDGANPRGSLLLLSNRLYGTTYNGALGSGTVFALNTNGSGFSNVYTFTYNSTAPYTNSDGAHPEAGLIYSGGSLYGTAYNGGHTIVATEYGTVFAISLSPPPASPPRLTITLSGTNVLLTWPTNATGFTLQAITNIVSTNWTNVSPPPVIVGGQNTVTNAVPGAQKFYRLSQ